jgi:tetratricopeptide (TPR) repeat protein
MLLKENIFELTIIINPNYADAWCWQGMALFQLQSYQEAITYLERAIKINPEHDLAKNILQSIEKPKFLKLQCDR